MGLEGHGLTKKVKEAVSQASNSGDFESVMFQILRDGRKAEFALDVLSSPLFSTLRVPPYISEGLLWLERKLKEKQSEVIAHEEAKMKKEDSFES